MKEVVDRIVQYPNRYKLTDVSTGQELGTYDFTEVTGTVQQEGTEINAELFESIEQDIENAGNFDPNGTYPNLTAGEATHAQSADTAANATNANYATSAGSASTATNATHATSADSATKATQDGLGRDIANTYALKSSGGTKYKHTITCYIWASHRYSTQYTEMDQRLSFSVEVELTRSTKIPDDNFGVFFNEFAGKAIVANGLYNDDGGADIERVDLSEVVSIYWAEDGNSVDIYYRTNNVVEIKTRTIYLEDISSRTGFLIDRVEAITD